MQAAALLVAALAATAWLAASPSAAQPVTAVAVQPKPARPADSGARDSAATVGPLAIGASVRDETGASLGRVTRLTTGKDGRDMVELRADEDTYSVPLDAMEMRDGHAVSRLSLDDLRHGRTAP